ncbi:hypothetical protein FE844_026210 (plasmid) [Rhizobium indicum]|uniref:hypothetical protein n=1 Tax=Rhizobium indicum TaxID=2583231 RepID=UPI001106422C|nr:hypothetical protein [Rhizobium indicum]QKK33103.1 hypothetical protein FE844_026210 [Rhizobium indicum]
MLNLDQIERHIIEWGTFAQAVATMIAKIGQKPRPASLQPLAGSARPGPEPVEGDRVVLTNIIAVDETARNSAVSAHEQSGDRRNKSRTPKSGFVRQRADYASLGLRCGQADCAGSAAPARLDLAAYPHRSKVDVKTTLANDGLSRAGDKIRANDSTSGHFSPSTLLVPRVTPVKFQLKSEICRLS